MSQQGTDIETLAADLSLTRGERGVLVRALGLRPDEPQGRLARGFYGPLRPSFDVLLALLVVAILGCAYYYFAEQESKLADSIVWLVVFVVLARHGSRSELLIRKLYWALAEERGRKAPSETPRREVLEQNQ